MTSVITSRRNGVNGSIAIKVPCKSATTANITLSGEQTVDGVALVDGDRILVKDQTDGSENGIYAVSTSTWNREPDWDGNRDIAKGTHVYVTDGSTTAGGWRITTDNPIVVGTTSITFDFSELDSTLRSQLADTSTDDGTAGFHLVHYPPLSGETGVVNYEYPVGDVRRYGAVCDGSTDDTSSVENANTSSLYLTFPYGKTCVLLNWVPLANTIISARGATIERLDDTTYASTGSSAALVNENNGVEIHGGTWGLGSGATAATWSGSILIDGGGIKINGAYIKDTWGGIFGNLNQTASNIAQNVSITHCEIDNCSHNTYLADIKDFTFSNNFSHDSDRDGLRTYRNIENATITDNHIYNNGNADAGQSRDGIDLYIEGFKAIVTGNYIYGNATAGMDIKINDVVVPDFGNHQYHIAGNFIYDNGTSGITMLDSTAAQNGMEDTAVINNHIYGNTDYGVLQDGCVNPKLIGNYIYDNGQQGARINGCTDIHIEGNTVHNNGTGLAAGTRIGIHVLASTGGIVTGNIVRPDGSNQVDGIFVATSTVKVINNDVSGHSSSNIYCDGSAVGKITSFPVTNDTTLHLLFAMKKEMCLVNASLLVNNTITSIDATVAKRSLSAGTFSATVVAPTGFANATAYADKDLGSLTVAQASIEADELLTFQLANITSGFTEGLLNVGYCD